MSLKIADLIHPAQNPNAFPHLINELSHQVNQIGHSLVHGASEHTGVKVHVCARHINVEITDATQAVGEAWLRFSQPIVVGDTHIVNVLKNVKFDIEKNY